MKTRQKTVNILGIRGIPAAHGGFETFAAGLAPYLLDNDWRVNVYCQSDDHSHSTKAPYFIDDYEGITRTHVGVKKAGPLGTIEFDWKCTLDVMRRPGIDLVLGYNTAVFTILHRLARRQVLMNMDGIEWKRAKWSAPAKAWFFLNEIIGAHTANIPIADHPEIAAHLRRLGCSKTVVIPYGSPVVNYADQQVLREIGVEKEKYFISISRIEPENSILEMVRAFSKTTRHSKLVVLGRFDTNNPYHARVKQLASDEVVFPGPIYDQARVQALRLYCTAYMHGHQVGGTNPSLVEALGCGNAVIAHDNTFNRWVAGEQQLFFSDDEGCSHAIQSLIDQPQLARELGQHSRHQHQAKFQLDSVHKAYLQELEKCWDKKKTNSP